MTRPAAVIICAGVAGPFVCNTVGQYLESCDFEAMGGRGHVTFTPDLNKAMKFRDKAHAMRYWRTRSNTVPTRPDGKPNRPLTAYHAVLEDIEEDAA